MRRWLGLAAVFALAALALAVSLSRSLHFPGRPDIRDVTAFFVLVLIAFTIIRGAVLLWRFVMVNEQHPFEAWIRAMRVSLPSFLTTITGMIVVCAFLVALGWLKSMLPGVVPFWADQPLGAFDRAIFGGHPPVRPSMIFTIAYAVWQPAHLGTILWVLHWSEGRDKDRAVLSFLLTWTIGMVLAFCFSSAGPIFMGQVSADPLTRAEARYLWANYKSAGAVIGGGISAFPSMHVAIACWIAFVLSLRHIKWVGPLFVCLVSLGAVALGWHYSLDVFGGVAVAFAAIFLTSKFEEFRKPRAHGLARAAA